ncbi:MAG: hypothetical protein AAGB22_11450, partial [Bacteroidota bacterium]
LFGGLLIDTHSMKNKRKQHEPEQRIPVEWVKDSQPRQVFQNQVDGGSALDGVIAQLAAKREAGDPSSVNLVLKVLPNALFGIAGGYDAYVKLTNIAECSQWSDALQDSIKDQLGTGELTDFPNVQVFKQNKDHLIQLTPKQANLLGDLAYWMVKTEATAYQQVLNGQPFS